MKKILLLFAIATTLLTSCASVRVSSDYDSKANFPEYKTFAFFKEGIDKVEVSDLDKKRILRSIEEEMIKKGFTLSENPDLLVNFFTKERERQDVYTNVGFGWGWGPFWGNNVSVGPVQTEGTLFIDLIDAKKKDLIWQGKGIGVISDYGNRDDRISAFVSEILKQYPPQKRR
ncbi:MAG: DUF4136 domain-containing protein [Capnocytophaga sp.]|nr:DUF4136 domain-containing protein [Capnocytophaga sp.]